MLSDHVDAALALAVAEAAGMATAVCRLGDQSSIAQAAADIVLLGSTGSVQSDAEGVVSMLCALAYMHTHCFSIALDACSELSGVLCMCAQDRDNLCTFLPQPSTYSACGSWTFHKQGLPMACKLPC